MNPLRQYRSYRSLLRSQWLNREAISVRQEARLRALVDHAYHHVPYYRELFDSVGLKPSHIRQLDDLQKIPITTKSMLQRAGPSKHVSEKYNLDALVQERTSGSTGQPFTSYFDPHFLSTRNGLFLRGLHVAGYRFGQKLLLITAGGKQLRPWLRWRYASIESSARDLVSELNRFRPTVLYGCTTPLRLMAEYIKASSYRAHLPKIVISTAETLDNNTLSLLKAGFGADVYDLYGLTEMGLVAWECPAHDGYHLSEDTTIVEFVRDDEHDASKLIMTNLELEAMPLIRFQTGDLASPVADRDCRCGRTLQRIRRIEGRLVDCLRLRDNTMVTPYRLTLALESISGLGRYQILQESSDRCNVRVEIGNSGQNGLEGKVREALSPVLGAQMQVRVTFEKSIAPAAGQKFRIVENKTGH